MGYIRQGLYFVSRDMAQKRPAIGAGLAQSSNEGHIPYLADSGKAEILTVNGETKGAVMIPKALM